ncbi:hypothetical protein D3C87_322650 [compost metagenome]
MRGWILMMVAWLGLALPAAALARECRAGQPVPDRYPGREAGLPFTPPPEHVRACQQLEQRDQALRPWVKPVDQGLRLLILGATLLAAFAGYRQWRHARAGRAQLYAGIALHGLAAWILLRIGLAAYRGVTELSVRGPPRWLWQEQSPVHFGVQQGMHGAIAIALLVAAWALLRSARPPRPANPLPRRGPRRR